MTISQIISLTILLFTLYLSLKKGNDFFSPAKLFLIVWSFCIFLTEFKFSGFQHQWSAYSWFVFLLGLIAFLLGIFIAYVTFLEKTRLSINTIRGISKVIKEEKLKLLFFITVILFTLYIVAFIAEVMIEGNVPILSERIEKARIEFGVFGLHLIVNFQLVIMFLSIEYIVLEKTKRFKKIIMWLIFFITLLTFALLLQRFNYFFWGIMTISLLYYASRKLTFKRILIILFIFFGFLWVIQSYRLSQYVSQYSYVISEIKYQKFPKNYAVLTEPYMYITMNLENMTRGVDRLENNIYGVSTFDWLLAISGLKHWILDYFEIEPRPFLISGYNTFAFHWYYYYDFGLVGIFILPLLTGLIIGIIYYMMRTTAKLKWVVIYSMCVATIFISFFTNPLTMLNIIIAIFILWCIHHFYVDIK